VVEVMRNSRAGRPAIVVLVPVPSRVAPDCQGRRRYPTAGSRLWGLDAGFRQTSLPGS
jgi:hypothetical protein